MAVRVITKTRENLLARRREILDGLGLNLTQYRRLLTEGDIGPAEWQVRDEIAEIQFLLGAE